MPTFAEIDRMRVCPEPAYPEYGQVVAAVRARGTLLDPAEISRMEQLVTRRGNDWCTAVLGFWMPDAGLRGISTREALMLVVADELDLNPALPERIAAQHQAARAAARQTEHRHAQAHRTAQRSWRDAIADCPVMLEVRPNRRGRQAGKNLLHVVPGIDVVSPASRARPRRHPAGRSLCETTGRAKPLSLGDPVEGPATCRRCLAFIPLISPVHAAGIAPPGQAAVPGRIETDSAQQEDPDQPTKKGMDT